MSGVSLPTRTRSPIPSGDPEGFVLTLWTDDPALAEQADAAGVQRIGIDLDRLGKLERQRGLGTWVSPHSERDLDAIAPALVRAELFARVNPLNADSAREVAAVIERGARVLMLPMVRSAREAAAFVALVDGAATVVLLAETDDALRGIGELAAVDGVDEVHIGINDLALSLGLGNRWMTLAGDLVKDAGATVRAAGKRFGVGAIGRPGDAGLPIPSELVYAEYARVGATAALVSRSFIRRGTDGLGDAIARARRELAAWTLRPAADLAAAHAELTERARRATWF